MADKDILVFVPTRSNPKALEDTVNMLYNTSSSKDNFDVLVVIDDDQIEMYSEVMKKFPDLIYSHPPHAGPNSGFIWREFYEFMDSHDYYFGWVVTDDFWGLRENWDANIVKRKKIFDDDFFTLYIANPLGRDLSAQASQYRIGRHPFDGHHKPLVTDPPFLIYHFCELLPICTKKWWQEIRKFYDENYVGTDVVFLCAALVYVLCSRFGYSRMLESGVFYSDLKDNNNTLKATVNGLNRDQYFMKWAVEEDFAIIMPVALSIASRIFDHYSDVRDEAYGIEKGWFKKE